MLSICTKNKEMESVTVQTPVTREAVTKKFNKLDVYSTYVHIYTCLDQ